MLQGKGLDRREFDDLLTLYYEAMGWDPKDGVPTRGKLADLNLYWLNEFVRDRREATLTNPDSSFGTPRDGANPVKYRASYSRASAARIDPSLP